MRVVTTCSREGFEQYGHRWLEGRKFWPSAEFVFYPDGFEVDCASREFPADFMEWRERHKDYQPPDWQWNVVKYAHKVFAACDALKDYDGIGVWLDADCVTYKKIPQGLIEKQVKDVYLAHYGRTGMYTETGMWIMDCRRPEHRSFLETWRDWYLQDKFVRLSQWHDCMTLDATIKSTGVKTKNLSGEHHLEIHPQAMTELGKYIDHCKGKRKVKGLSQENKWHAKA